jgi:hypothetical protein
MTKMPVLPISRKRVIVEGVPYTVSVYVVENTYLAAWLCGACSHRSEIALEGPTTDAAVERAKVDLADHHAALHSQSSH